MQKPLQSVTICYYYNEVLYSSRCKEMVLANELCACPAYKHISHLTGINKTDAFFLDVRVSP